MTILIKKGEPIEEAVKKLQQEIIDKKKAAKLAAFGKVPWNEDALSFQKRIRDEWS